MPSAFAGTRLTGPSSASVQSPGSGGFTKEVGVRWTLAPMHPADRFVRRLHEALIGRRAHEGCEGRTKGAKGAAAKVGRGSPDPARVPDRRSPFFSVCSENTAMRSRGFDLLWHLCGSYRVVAMHRRGDGVRMAKHARNGAARGANMSSWRHSLMPIALAHVDTFRVARSCAASSYCD